MNGFIVGDVVRLKSDQKLWMTVASVQTDVNNNAVSVETHWFVCGMLQEGEFKPNELEKAQAA